MNAPLGWIKPTEEAKKTDKILRVLFVPAAIGQNIIFFHGRKCLTQGKDSTTVAAENIPQDSIFRHWQLY